MTTTNMDAARTRLFALIGYYAAQASDFAEDLKESKAALEKAEADRDAYGEGIHALGARVAGLQTRVLELEKERDTLRQQVVNGDGYIVSLQRIVEAVKRGELVSALDAARAPYIASIANKVIEEVAMLKRICDHIDRAAAQTTQEGTGAAPPAALDPAQRVTAPEVEAGAPTRTEPAGRSVQSNKEAQRSNNEPKEEHSQAAEGSSGAGYPADGAPTLIGPSNAAATTREGEQPTTERDLTGAPGDAAETPAPGPELSDERIPFVPADRVARGATPVLPDPFLDDPCADHRDARGDAVHGDDSTCPRRPICGASITDRDNEHRESVCSRPPGHADDHFDVITGTHWTDATTKPAFPPWWRYAVGPPKGAYHLFTSADSAEAECGETTDDETRPAPNLPPHEQTCMDCMDLAAQRGIKLPVERSPEPEEPPEAVGTEEPDADEGAAPGRKYVRKPRVCIVPGCDRPGHAAKNEHGARDSGGLWCDEHAKDLTAEERRDIHARDKAWKRKLKREAAAKAKAPEEAA